MPSHETDDDFDPIDEPTTDHTTVAADRDADGGVDGEADETVVLTDSVLVAEFDATTLTLFDLDAVRGVSSHVDRERYDYLAIGSSHPRDDAWALRASNSELPYDDGGLDAFYVDESNVGDGTAETVARFRADHGD